MAIFDFIVFPFLSQFFCKYVKKNVQNSWKNTPCASKKVKYSTIEKHNKSRNDFL